MSDYIYDLIDAGENQMLDFKFCITDSRKIARTLVSFANTDGGTLLLGVKDNGKIAGVRSDEEYYMIEAAAQMYSKPEIVFNTRTWTVQGKTVMEVKVAKSENPPHFAQNEEGKWLAYIRVADQNILANKVMLEVWKRSKLERPVRLKLSKEEDSLLKYLKDHDHITLSAFSKIAFIPRLHAEKILVDYILVGIINIHFTEKGAQYSLNPEYDPEKL